MLNIDKIVTNNKGRPSSIHKIRNLFENEVRDNQLLDDVSYNI
jgi:hypothetical protein